MGTDVSKEIQTRRSASEILSILHQYKQSNLTVRRFCEAQNLNKGTFNTWKKRYRSQVTLPGNSNGFMELQVSSAFGATQLFAEVNGIRIYQPVSADFLKALIA
jgi:hypothetical protein